MDRQKELDLDIFNWVEDVKDYESRKEMIQKKEKQIENRKTLVTLFLMVSFLFMLLTMAGAIRMFEVVKGTL